MIDTFQGVYVNREAVYKSLIVLVVGAAALINIGTVAWADTTDWGWGQSTAEVAGTELTKWGWGQPTRTPPSEERPVLWQLGDSVAAGAGLPAATAASSDDRRCRRSPEAYSTRVAEELGMRAMNVACTGASAWTVVRSQLRQVHDGPEPTTVLLSVGANDVRWSYFLLQCARSDCATTVHARTFQGLLTAAKAGVTSTLTGLQLAGADRVYLTGYYDPFSGSGTSPEQVGFSTAEVSWYTERLTELNSMLQEAAANHEHVIFVPVNMGTQPTQTVQSLRDPMPFHPTSAGHEVIAEAILGAGR
jgi:lysophospholipase L1-like esterase